MSQTVSGSAQSASQYTAAVTPEAALAELVVIAGDPDIIPTMRLVDVDIDSLDIIEWLERIEEVLGVVIADAEVFEEISPLITVGELIDQMLSHTVDETVDA
jgi:acyl carrier protein